MFLRHSISIIAKQPDVNQIKKLAQIKAQGFVHLRKHYPHVFISNHLQNKIAYMRRYEPPNVIIKQGGFIAKTHENIWLAEISGKNDTTCQNQGAICLTLLPEITTIFLSSYQPTKTAYIYAVPLIDECVLLGGKWRQIIYPGALPLPSFWRGREVLKIDEEKVLLGPVFGQGEMIQPEVKITPGERYQTYLYNQEIKIPEKIGISEDYPEEYNIQDTIITRALQKEIAEHYRHQHAYTASRSTLL